MNFLLVNGMQTFIRFGNTRPRCTHIPFPQKRFWRRTQMNCFNIQSSLHQLRICRIHLSHLEMRSIFKNLTQAPSTNKMNTSKQTVRIRAYNHHRAILNQQAHDLVDYLQNQNFMIHCPPQHAQHITNYLLQKSITTIICCNRLKKIPPNPIH